MAPAHAQPRSWAPGLCKNIWWRFFEGQACPPLADSSPIAGRVYPPMRVTMGWEMNSLSFDKAGSNAKMCRNNGVCRPKRRTSPSVTVHVLLRHPGTVGSQNGVRRRPARSAQVYRIEV